MPHQSRHVHSDPGDVELLVVRTIANRSGEDTGSEDDPSEDAQMRSLLGCERNPKTSFATRTVGVLMCCCRLVPRMWSLNNKVAHVPRVVPIDGSGEIRAAVVRAGGAVGCEGLAEALAVPNTVRNQKYSATTFVFQVLYEQFSYFSNLYFLLVALSQFIPALQVGFLFTYIAPLVFVLGVTLLKEGIDDFHRWRRDREANGEVYRKLLCDGRQVDIPSSDIAVGDLIYVPAGARVPADMVLMRTSDKSGAVFIRTDQLDGETDWKLRRAVHHTQQQPSDAQVPGMQARVWADMPVKEIDYFVGNFIVEDVSHIQRDSEARDSGAPEEVTEPLSIENTLWCNTVVCGGHALGLVVYTGVDTRVAMNADPPKSKVGLVDLEINNVSKMLFALSFALSVILVLLKGGAPDAAMQSLVRFIILFSSIIPISLRVNIDMAKTAFSSFMMADREIPGTIVRSSFIPEELGRIDYLLSDKTGTLTQNHMDMKEINLGEVSYGEDSMAEAFDDHNEPTSHARAPIPLRVRWLVEALALCHNVNVTDGGEGAASRFYQASSPDEIALVTYAKAVGLELLDRTLNHITVSRPNGAKASYEILNLFPFSSETKRMGIILMDTETGKILFFMKGADVAMIPIVEFSDWLDEECGNLARKGLRTLVNGMKILSKEEYAGFSQRYEAAKRQLYDRDAAIRSAVEELECNLTLLGLTGVEDKLQDDVAATLEMLGNAGVRVWMLTGDKVETATNIAVSSKLFSRNAPIFHLSAETREQAEEQFSRLQKRPGTCLVIDGRSLALCTENFPRQFVEAACACPAVVCCRCAPTQKALVVRLLKRHAGRRCAAIGDGGNDVAMIQAADVGIGIEGKEGKQASLAADFSLTKFAHVSRLMLWHGRNSYSRSARLSQFIIHRGLIISIIQVVFSSLFYFATIAIYSGWLVVGYSTVFTMLPVFSLILDEDVDVDTVFMYPELYKELQKGRHLCLRTFLEWVFKSIYQGGVIMLLSIFLFDHSFLRIISITFTALLLTELLMVALEIHRWRFPMLIAQVLSLVAYAIAILLLPSYFDVGFIFSGPFWIKVVAITLVSCLPVTVGKWLRQACAPPAYLKLARSRELEGRVSEMF